jgi:hypothetical protein
MQITTRRLWYYAPGKDKRITRAILIPWLAVQPTGVFRKAPFAHALIIGAPAIGQRLWQSGIAHVEPVTRETEIHASLLDAVLDPAIGKEAFAFPTAAAPAPSQAIKQFLEIGIGSKGRVQRRKKGGPTAKTPKFMPKLTGMANNGAVRIIKTATAIEPARGDAPQHSVFNHGLTSLVIFPMILLAVVRPQPMQNAYAHRHDKHQSVLEKNAFQYLLDLNFHEAVSQQAL